VTETRLVLGQGSVEVKSNEITAIPNLLDLLDLTGATATIDAMGCQKAIARQIVERGGDYVLALKDNHPILCEEVRLWLDTEAEAGRLPVWDSGFEKDHGRLERRCYWLSERVDWLPELNEWTGLKAVGRVERYREIDGKASCERSYFLCSHTALESFSRVVRNHWGIENQQHIGCWTYSLMKTVPCLEGWP
jgi:predicted transposase YbfD/YdcC